MRIIHDKGVTLLELVCGLALVAVLAGLAAPSFRAAARATAVRSAAYELMTGLQQTRGNSIVEARPGVLCLTDAAGICLDASAPAPAWRSYLESGTGSAESGAQTVAIRALPAGVSVRGSRTRIRFWPTSLAASTGTLTICDAQGLAPPRAIVISQNGRARFAAAASDGCDA
jgi:type IV fimbrial biogenesis protein FimT